MNQIAATSYMVVVTCVIIFQFFLIAGAPWGKFTQGGSHEGALPKSGRIIALFSVPLLIFMALAIKSAAGMTPNWPTWTAYVAIGIQALSTLLNWITPSKPERLLWAPITTIMLALAVYAVFA